jgi:hypothetical protein
MSKVSDALKNFDEWMKRYNHENDSNSESLKNFITCDGTISEFGMTYDEYVALALAAKGNNYAIDWIVSYKTFGRLVKK